MKLRYIIVYIKKVNNKKIICPQFATNSSKILQLFLGRYRYPSPTVSITNAKLHFRKHITRHHTTKLRFNKTQNEKGASLFTSLPTQDLSNRHVSDHFKVAYSESPRRRFCALEKDTLFCKRL